MLKLGKLTDYATLVMAELAATPGETRNAHDVAQCSHVAAPTVAKLLRQLSHAELVVSERGAHGGYRLAREPESITIADIVIAVEGPVALTECAGSHSCCSIEHHCGVRTNWRLINTAIQRALESVTLAQMAEEAHPHELPAQESTVVWMNNSQHATSHESTR